MKRDDEPIERWTLEEREHLEDCRVFQVERRRMRRAAGAADFFVIDSPDWINVVALTDSDELVLVEQWRHGVRDVTLEVPGGMVDEGEEPAESARRELLEETGYAAREWYLLGEVEPNPAILTNRCGTYLALGAAWEREPEFDGHEDCRLVRLPWAEADRAVAEGRITHSLTVAAFHWETLRRTGTLTPIRLD